MTPRMWQSFWWQDLQFLFFGFLTALYPSVSAPQLPLPSVSAAPPSSAAPELFSCFFSCHAAGCLATDCSAAAVTASSVTTSIVSAASYFLLEKKGALEGSFVLGLTLQQERQLRRGSPSCSPSEPARCTFIAEEDAFGSTQPRLFGGLCLHHRFSGCCARPPNKSNVRKTGSLWLGC